MRDYVVIDIETTGISPEFANITEIGAVKIKGGKEIASYNQLINPGVAIPPKIIELTGIDDAMVSDQPFIEEVLNGFFEFCEDYPILGHNVIFDFSFLKINGQRQRLSFEKKGLDTLVLARHFLKNQPSYSLTNLIKACGIERENAHRAYDDAYATYELYELIYEKFHCEETSYNFDPKYFLWKPMKHSPITDKQKKFLTSLIKKHEVMVDYEIETLSKSEASKKIDGILREYGRS